MHATIRRYDGVDQNRTTELTSKVNETLVPKLTNLPGFKGYYLIDAGNGVFSSLSLFETSEQGMESSKFVATWIRDEKLDPIVPNEPKITRGASWLTATASWSPRNSMSTASDGSPGLPGPHSS